MNRQVLTRRAIPSWGAPPDIDRKILVEHRAIEVVKQHYRDNPINRIKSVAEENIGWDLEILQNGLRYRQLEVKGLSALTVRVGLTPNEYRALQAHMAGENTRYRLCIVSGALDETPRLHILLHDLETGRWKDEIFQSEANLSRVEFVSAIITVEL